MKSILPESIHEVLHKVFADGSVRVHKLQDDFRSRLLKVRGLTVWPRQREELQRQLQEWKHRLQQNRENLERNLDERARSVHHKLTASIIDELNRLRAEAERLSQRIDKLHQKKNTP